MPAGSELNEGLGRTDWEFVRDAAKFMLDSWNVRLIDREVELETIADTGLI